MEEEGEPPNEEEEEPTSEFVDGLELFYGRGKSGYKDVYPRTARAGRQRLLSRRKAYAAWASSRP